MSGVQAAYVEGLTHAGAAKTELEQNLVLMRTALRRMDNCSFVGFDLLKQIGRITYTGLLPLRNAAQTTLLPIDGVHPRFDYG